MDLLNGLEQVLGIPSAQASESTPKFNQAQEAQARAAGFPSATAMYYYMLQRNQKRAQTIGKGPSGEANQPTPPAQGGSNAGGLTGLFSGITDAIKRATGQK